MVQYSNEAKKRSTEIRMEFSGIVDNQERSVMIIGGYEDSTIVIFYNHLKNQKQTFEMVADSEKVFRRICDDESDIWRGLLVTSIEDQTLESFELLKKLSQNLFRALEGKKNMDH